LLSLIDHLDIKAEVVPLTETERVVLRNANDALSSLMRDEEIKWAQRAKIKHVQEGVIIQKNSI
jgi:hypothetical protein